MIVDIDMWRVRLAQLTSAELQLLDRVRAAAEKLDITIEMALQRRYPKETFALIAHIGPEPLRIDFALYERSRVWELPRSGPILFTGPQTPIDGKLFNEDGFTPQFQKQIRAAVEATKKDWEGA
jgi:hypothetical protein